MNIRLPAALRTWLQRVAPGPSSTAAAAKVAEARPVNRLEGDEFEATAPPKNLRADPPRIPSAPRDPKELWAESQAGLRVFPHPEVGNPGDGGGLRVATFNVHLSGKRLPEVEAELSALRLEALFLQECRRSSARRLGDALGMHVAVSGRSGKAVLCRHPIELAEEVPLDGPAASRDGEPAYKRSILRVAAKVGDRGVDLLDVHLDLRDPQARPEEARRVAEYIDRRGRSGRILILSGDFGANSALAGMLQHGWRGSDPTVSQGGVALSPEQAQAELASGLVEEGSDRFNVLLRVVGISQEAARQRFDNILASRDVRIRTEVALVDRTAVHPAVVSDVVWR